MHRFFIPAAWISGRSVRIVGARVHQLRNVLRMTQGDTIKVLDNSGWEYQVELTSVGPELAEGHITSKVLVRSEPRTKIVIYQAVLEGSSFALVLQKGTEIGVVGFVPMISDRCVVGVLGEVSEQKINRWHSIILEAAEQSGRGKLPVLYPVLMFRSACEQATGASIMPWEEEHSLGLRQWLDASSAASRRSKPMPPPLRPERGGGGREPLAALPFTVNIFVGPEGGFSAAEAAFARECGITTVSLGLRILRAETAGLVATTTILAAWGDLG